MANFNVQEMIKRIESLLVEKGMSKEEFYTASKVSSASYSQWNTGLHKPTPKKVFAMAECLGVSVGFLTGKEEQKPIVADSFMPDKLKMFDGYDPKNKKSPAPKSAEQEKAIINNIVDNSQFIYAIEYHLSKKNISIDQFLKDTGIPLDTFYDWRIGVSAPTNETVKQIESYLNTNFYFMWNNIAKSERFNRYYKLSVANQAAVDAMIDHLLIAQSSEE